MGKIANQNPRIEKDEDRGKAETEALFLSIGEGAIVTDEFGNISRINEVALKILGYDRNEVIGAWYPKAVRAFDESGKPIENLDRPIFEAVVSGKPIFRKIYVARKDKGLVDVAQGDRVVPALQFRIAAGALSREFLVGPR